MNLPTTAKNFDKRFQDIQKQALEKWISENQKVVKETQEKEQRLLSLLKSKTEKIVNDNFIKNFHQSLYSFSKEEQDIHLSVAKSVILDRLILYLEKF